MTITPNLGLKKPGSSDPIDISALNDNADTLDAFAGETNTTLAAKQDTITDLSEIRSGAAAGATAVQPASLSAETSARKAADSKMQAAIGAVANAGAKNLFKNTAKNKTYQGVTFTVNDDGTVSLSGTAYTAASVLGIGSVTLPAGSYIVSGCPAGGSWSPNPNKYRIRVAKNGSWTGDETGNGLTITVDGSDTIGLQINSSVGFDTAGLVFKPMIRPASITDDTFVPYAPTNRELYEMILALQSGIST